MAQADWAERLSALVSLVGDRQARSKRADWPDRHCRCASSRPPRTARAPQTTCPAPQDPGRALGRPRPSIRSFSITVACTSQAPSAIVARGLRQRRQLPRRVVAHAPRLGTAVQRRAAAVGTRVGLTQRVVERLVEEVLGMRVGVQCTHSVIGALNCRVSGMFDLEICKRF